MSLDPELSDEQSRQIVSRIREELARRRISRQQLADDAKLSISTLEKALSGRRPFTRATTIRLEEALGLSLRSAPDGAIPGLAPAHLGSYARPAVSWLENDYLTLRPSFDDAESVYAYRTEICWDDAACSLIFRESARQDAAFTQSGAVSLPNQSGHIYLMTNMGGQFRLITLGRPTIAGDLYGVLSTLQVGHGSQLVPTAGPIALVKLTGGESFGRIGPEHDRYLAYRAHIRRITAEGFARFLQA